VFLFKNRKNKKKQQKTKKQRKIKIFLLTFVKECVRMFTVSKLDTYVKLLTVFSTS